MMRRAKAPRTEFSGRMYEESPCASSNCDRHSVSVRMPNLDYRFTNRCRNEAVGWFTN
jgi:hypothetical protein